MESKMQRVMRRFDSRCAFCSNRVWPADKGGWSPATPRHSRATIDHALPKSRGGTNADENLLLACAACNGAKDDMTDGEFRSFIATGRLPMSYLQFLVKRMRSTVQRQIPHVTIPVEAAE